MSKTSNFKPIILKAVELGSDLEFVSFKTIEDNLSKLRTSYRNFLEAETFNNETLNKYINSIDPTNQKILDGIFEKFELVVTDVKISSFQFGIAQKDILVADQLQLFDSEIIDWGHEQYGNYFNNIFLADYNSYDTYNKIRDNYQNQPDYLKKVLDPIILLRSNYSLSIINDGNAKNLTPPSDEFREYYKSILPDKTDKNKSKKMIALSNVKVGVEGDFKITRTIAFLDVKNIFSPEIIKYDNYIYILNKPLNCKVDYSDNNYIIEYQELDIMVWDSEFELAKDAFYFAFHSLYSNFALEDDSNLSTSSKKLKVDLLNIVSKVIQS